MKTMRKISILLLVMSLLVSCKSKKTESSLIDDPSAAVCVWDKVSLKESPEDNGKWLASLTLGEQCTSLKDTKVDNSGKKPVTYLKVKLKDGKEGWVQSDFVIVQSKAGAIIQETEIYSRPDLLTKSKNTFSPMDIVAVKSEQGEFVEVTGKRKNGKWIESGWIKPANVSYSSVDIAVASFANKALSINDKNKRTDAIKEIVKNPDFSSSLFMDKLNGMLDDSVSKEVTQPVNPETPEESSGKD